MDVFLDAFLAAIRGQPLILFPAIHEEEIGQPLILLAAILEEEIGQFLILFEAIHEEEIGRGVHEPQDGRLMHLQGLGAAELRVFEPVLQNPGEFLMRRHSEEYSGNDYLGVQQHLQVELDAPEQVEDTDNEEEELFGNDHLGLQPHRQEELDAPEQVEDLDEEKETMDSTKVSSEDVDAMRSASQHFTKRDDSTTDDRRLLEDIISTSSSVATIGLQDSAMPGASPAAFGPILESATTSEKLNTDQVDGSSAQL